MLRKIGIGCGIVFVLLVVAAVAVSVFVPEVVQWVRKQVAAEMDRRQLAAEWQPPATDAGPDSLFPAQVVAYQLESHDEAAAIREFRFHVAGRHAVYRSGPSRVDVFVYKGGESTKEDLYQRLDDVYENGKGSGGSRHLTRLSYRGYYWSPEHQQNHVWWLKSWLFVFRTTDSEDREGFVLAYLKAIGPRGQAG